MPEDIEIGSIQRTDRKSDFDNAIAFIENEEKEDRHWHCSWTVESDGRLIHHCVKSQGG